MAEWREGLFNWIFVALLVAELTTLALFIWGRDTFSMGPLIYVHCICATSIFMFLAKCCSDREDSRYTVFVIFAASNLIAFFWLAIGPWIFTRSFYDANDFCM